MPHVTVFAWYCVHESDVRKKEKFSVLLALDPVRLVITTGRMTWFGLDERKDHTDWIKDCAALEVNEVKQRGCQKKLDAQT